MSEPTDHLFAGGPDEGARWGLLALMTGLSEEFWAAGWLIGLEFSLWKMTLGGSRKFGLGEISERQVMLLRLLAEEADGWWCWLEDDADNPRFLSLDGWRARVASLSPAQAQGET